MRPQSKLKEFRPMKQQDDLLISEELWKRISEHAPSRDELRRAGRNYRRRAGGGRKPIHDDRTIFSAILYKLRTGIPWDKLPSALFGGLSSTTAFEKFQLWKASGFFHRIWEAGLVENEAFEGIEWEWRTEEKCQCQETHDNVQDK